jgi:hypothetical protein
MTNDLKFKRISKLKNLSSFYIVVSLPQYNTTGKMQQCESVSLVSQSRRVLEGVS